MSRGASPITATATAPKRRKLRKNEGRATLLPLLLLNAKEAVNFTSTSAHLNNHKTTLLESKPFGQCLQVTLSLPTNLPIPRFGPGHRLDFDLLVGNDRVGFCQKGQNYVKRFGPRWRLWKLMVAPTLGRVCHAPVEGCSHPRPQGI